MELFDSFIDGALTNKSGTIESEKIWLLPNKYRCQDSVNKYVRSAAKEFLSKASKPLSEAVV